MRILQILYKSGQVARAFLGHAHLTVLVCLQRATTRCEVGNVIASGLGCTRMHEEMYICSDIYVATCMTIWYAADSNTAINSYKQLKTVKCLIGPRMAEKARHECAGSGVESAT